MKKLLRTLFVLCFLLSISIPLFAQVAETPNLGLNIVSPGTVNWGPLVNENFTILDTKVPTLNLNCSDGQVATWAAGKFSICTTPAVGGGAGHVIWSSTTSFTARSKLRFLGTTIADNAANDSTDVTIITAASGLSNVPAGSISAITVQAAINELDSEKQPADADLTNISGLVCTGGIYRSAANTYECRTPTGHSNVLTITNADGIAGAPVYLIANSLIDGSSHFAADSQASDVYVACPLSISTMSTPSYQNGSEHLIRFNTANTDAATINLCTLGSRPIVKVTPAGVSIPLATGDILVGANYKITYHSGNGNFQLMNPSTATAGGGAVGSDTQVTFNNAGVSAGDSGLTFNATTNVLTALGGVTSGDCTTNCTGQNNTATGLRTATWAISADYDIAGTTGTKTQNQVPSYDSLGRLESSGTTKWFKAQWDTENLILPSGSTCTRASVAAINGGPSGEWVSCTDAASSTFEGRIKPTRAITTGTFMITVNDSDSSAHVFSGNFSAMCRGNGDTVNSTWGSNQLVSITMTTANVNYTGTTAALTPNGVCDADATLFWRFVVDAAGAHTDANAKIINILFTQAS